ncbi:sugar transferase [Geomonas azotofigens]|uniref:sugar transferase n=1 Tax=Geomonas azotofigens TaxID=2843196 RepID=UPI001C1251C1|nr:sugar transferase [Geomonas azotofigens]MBU5613391.1 sugar transferase [Geomonas azotofigens]
MAKRGFDILFTVPGLVLLAPLFAFVAVWIKLDSSGPVFFRQVRVGQNGRPFRIYKFRTMCMEAEARGRQITVGEDPRITASGRLLRKYKLDELPQLINVLMGDMSLVGPRPEVPRYVSLYPDSVRDVVLSVKPGITDRASIEYRDENKVLGAAADPDRAYVEEIMPVKLGYYVRYVQERSLWIDIKLVFATLWALLGKR